MEEKKSKLLAKRSQSDKRDKKDKEKQFTPGCLVKFSGFKEDSKVNPLQLKNFLNTKEIVAAYVDLAGTSGIIRAPNPDAAAKVLQFADPFEGTTLSFSMVEGDDEKTYYAKLNCNAQKKHGRKKYKRF